MNFTRTFRKILLTSRTVAVCSAILACCSTSLGQIINLHFNEGGGTTTLNAGISGGTGSFVLQNGSPTFSTNVPTGAFSPAANISSVDFGVIGGTDGSRAIDFAPATVVPTIGLSAFTLTGWVNLRATQIGPGGNRIFSTWSGEGVDSGIELVQESNGRLRFSVNEAPDFAGPGPFSSTGRLTIDANTLPSNWVFFGVTYNANDPGVTNDGSVNYYFGNGSTPAVLDLTATYDRGVVNAQNAGETGTLTIGNFTTDVAARTATGAGSRVLRGLVDELQLHAGVLTQSEIQALQIVPEPGSALLCALGLTVFAARRRRAPHLHSASRLLIAACLAVLASQSTTFAATLVDLRFNEGNGTTTSNLGTSGGSGTFAEQNGSPTFSSNIPTGAFAPIGNVSSIDFGPIGPSDGSRAIDFPDSTATPTFGLSAFTVTGWLNLRDQQIGPGGNRILTTWPGEFGSDRGGFEVVQESSGRLRFSVNEAPDFPGPGPFSSVGRLTIDPNTSVGNWIFFAVTYDAGDLNNPDDGTVNYYFGNGSTAASLDATATYDRGSILNVAPGKSGTLTVGNFTTDVGARFEAGGGSRVLRGLVDEVRFFDSVLTATQVQAVQTIPEPGCASLLALGLASLGARRKRQA